VTSGLLEGLTVVESSLLEPGALGMLLAGFGADVVKVESPGEGDYVRRMAWPFVHGVSILHWQVNRGKRSIVIDLKKPEGVEVFTDLVRRADVVVEGMRPGALARRGLGYEQLRQVNPRIVFCTVSGWGMTGPYRDMPSHGIGFDAWAGAAPPAVDEDGFAYIQDLTSIGTRAAPAFAAAAVLAGVIHARSAGEGCQLDVAQSDVAAACNWLAISGYKAYERPESEVTGNPSDGGERRRPGTGGMKEGVRYQYYRSKDGHVLFMASERAFWENFCNGIDRPDLFETHPGSKYADHAAGDTALRRQLQSIFETRTTWEWVEFGARVNTPIGPVNDSESILADPQFEHRFPWLPAEDHGADLMPLPVKVVGDELPRPAPAPTLGQHTDEVLSNLLGYDAGRIAGLHAAGVIDG
jgi:crotonobetainyl-CoA:carnitine CoA-transferase CaiB-like acyl-CoA transferase